MGNHAPTYTYEKHCPVCNRRIRTLHQFGVDIDMPCECVNAAVSAKKAAAIERGTAIIHDIMRENAGIPQTMRDVRLDGMNVELGQEKAYRAAVEFVERYTSGETRGSMIISGAVGCGKTLIAAAISNAVIDAAPVDEGEAERTNGCIKPLEVHTPVLFRTEPKLCEELRAAVKDKYSDRMTARLAMLPLVVIDDMGTETPLSEFVKEQIYAIVNARYEREKPIIITTNCKRDELISRYGDRVYSRLTKMCGGELTVISSPDLRRTQK